MDDQSHATYAVRLKRGDPLSEPMGYRYLSIGHILALQQAPQELVGTPDTPTLLFLAFEHTF